MADTITLETLDLKLDGIADDMAEMKTMIHEMNGRQRIDHDRIVRLEERVSTHARIQAALSTVLAAISAANGSFMK